MRAIVRCRNCAAPMPVSAGESVLTCESCGARSAIAPEVARRLADHVEVVGRYRQMVADARTEGRRAPRELWAVLLLVGFGIADVLYLIALAFFWPAVGLWSVGAGGLALGTVVALILARPMPPVWFQTIEMTGCNNCGAHLPALTTAILACPFCEVELPPPASATARDVAEHRALAEREVVQTANEVRRRAEYERTQAIDSAHAWVNWIGLYVGVFGGMSLGTVASERGIVALAAYALGFMISVPAAWLSGWAVLAIARLRADQQMRRRLLASPSVANAEALATRPDRPRDLRSPPRRRA